ncbi:beta-N-acetylhexosaminidase [Pedobacter ginsengisoli]|uniref:beta-N-acetylhexosaminidase n=1 Tax=Pedobacter ginsengisoli TaxID=363852 RepID=A0A2D1U0P3_9SPHI|nr:family 20 glycosylhydrolase [Pedobacter ginsengisoli]ATP55202.1 beta-N-acetylhexosaminidase [Pedobacter ginsengisoli]
MKKFCILIALLFSGLINSYAQRSSPFNVRNLYITREVLSNAEDKTLSVLTITNNGKQALPGKGWSIYFNSRPMEVAGSDSLSARIKHVNGDLFRLYPIKGFSDLKSGRSMKIQVLSTEVKNITDLSSGFYLVWDNNPSKGYNISHKDVYPIQHVGRIETDVAAHVFNQNKQIKDIPLEKLPKVFPTPLSYVEGDGTFKLTPEVSIITEIEFDKEARLFADELSTILGKRPAFVQPPAKNVIVIKRGNVSGPESYKLSVTPERILITAAEPAGAFYGIQSLKTLLPSTSWGVIQKEIAIPAVEIEDAPRFGFRGFMMDVARNFQSKKEVLKVLDVMALYKMNVLHFHLNDDEGWRLEIQDLPELTTVGSQRGHTIDDGDNIVPSYGSGSDIGVNSGSGFYTRSDFIEILKYAAARHIRVIPEIETPGHARAAIKSMDARYKRLMKAGKKEEAEQYLLRDLNDKSIYESVQGWNDNVINVALPSAYNFLEKVVDEIRFMYTEAKAPLATIHFGGDEVPAGVWERSPAVANLLKADASVSGVDEMWYYYFNKINNMLKAKQLYLSGWEEIGLRKALVNGEKKMVLDERFAKENFHADVWNNLSGNEDLAYKLANAGYKVVLTCVTNLYLDLAINKSFNETGQYWGGYVDVDKPYYFVPYELFKNLKEDEGGNPIDKKTLEGKTTLTEFGKSNIVGIQAPLWSEIIKTPERFEYMLLPKLFGVAERAWAKNPEWATETDTVKSASIYNQNWSEFVNIIGKREMPRLNHYAGGYNYRIPTPGVVVANGKVMANLQLPGFIIRYTTDGTEPTVNSAAYLAPLSTKGDIIFKVFNNNGRSGRSVKIHNN